MTEVDVATQQVIAGVAEPIPMPDKTAITIQLDGAEYLDLLARAGNVNLSLPAFVLKRATNSWPRLVRPGLRSPNTSGRDVISRSATHRFPAPANIDWTGVVVAPRGEEAASVLSTFHVFRKGQKDAVEVCAARVTWFGRAIANVPGFGSETEAHRIVSAYI